MAGVLVDVGNLDSVSRSAGVSFASVAGELSEVGNLEVAGILIEVNILDSGAGVAFASMVGELLGAGNLEVAVCPLR